MTNRFSPLAFFWSRNPRENSAYPKKYGEKCTQFLEQKRQKREKYRQPKVKKSLGMKNRSKKTQKVHIGF